MMALIFPGSGKRRGDRGTRTKAEESGRAELVPPLEEISRFWDPLSILGKDDFPSRGKSN